jgi:hypothetical protein
MNASITTSLAMAAALLSLVAPREARAYEDTIEVAAGVGYAMRLDGSSDLDLGDHGLTFVGTMGFGLNDAWSLRITGLNQTFFPEPRLRRSALLFEATYALDVVRVVPVLGAGVGAGLDGLRGEHGIAPAFSVFASLDVLLGRKALFGPEFRLLVVPFTGLDGVGDLSFAASVRLAYLWDRF